MRKEDSEGEDDSHPSKQCEGVGSRVILAPVYFIYECESRHLASGGSQWVTSREEDGGRSGQ